MSNQTSGLNPAQLSAVTHTQGHLLIVAGPGTGKTHTLTYRIAQNARRLPGGERILAITFTNKAAQEMRERLSARLSGIDSCLTVGTFHQFCLNLLLEYSEEADLPAVFHVASPEETEGIAEEIWPEKRKRERKLILEEISRWKADNFDGTIPEEVILYNEKLRKKGLLDFDDLLRESLSLLKTNAKIRNDVQQVYRNIFVDEYQDINAVQHALLKVLIGGTGTITAIGDPNQAIYGFRGSDVRYFNSFAQDFPGAVILSLSENYRSAQNLLSASGQVMASAAGVHVPELTAKIYSEGRLTVYAAPTEKAEAEYVVHQIEKMIGGTSMFSQDSGRVGHEDTGVCGFGDIAVLYRLNSQRLALEEAFDRSGIPYQVSGIKASQKEKDLIEDFYFERGNDVCVATEKVSLMTLHAAKGLEFPAVFIAGCEQNILPLNLENLTSDCEEERRLFYVGMTRAKERLFLTHAKRRRLYGKIFYNGPSEFLSDIEEELKNHEKSSLRPKRREKNEDQMSLF